MLALCDFYHKSLEFDQDTSVKHTSYSTSHFSFSYHSTTYHQYFTITQKQKQKLSEFIVSRRASQAILVEVLQMIADSNSSHKNKTKNAD